MPPQLFKQVPYAELDPIFELTAAFAADPAPHKVSLGAGAYRDENAKPYILKSVKAAKDRLQDANHEYSSILGDPIFRNAAAKLVFGKDSKSLSDGRVASAQSISGTGACHYAAVFLRDFYDPSATVYITSPTWSNHRALFEAAGFKVEEYQYYNAETRSVDYESVKQAIKSAKNGSIFILHPCAHNPTGCDLTQEQWKEVAAIIEEKEHVPVLDGAYQGFASGDLERDGWTLRYFFEERKLNGIACQSFSKSMGLYGERVGCVHIACADATLAKNISSQLSQIVRREVSSPPVYGARIASLILTTPELFSLWEEDLIYMSGRIMEMRQKLVEELTRLGTPGTWNHVTDQIGMFSFTGLTVAQVQFLKKEKSIYMSDNGRISVAGLNASNIEYFAKCMDEAVRTH